MKQELGKLRHFWSKQRLYLSLLCGTIVITVIGTIIPQDSPWFAAITGIGCGGVASTIVAWLIDWANSKKSFEEVIRNRRIMFDELFSAFQVGLQLLIILMQEHLHSDATKKWYEWVEYSYQIAEDNDELLIECNMSMRIFFDDIAEQLFKIDAQKALLLEYGILDENDVKRVSLMLSLCELTLKGCQMTEDEEKRADNIKRLCQFFRILIKESCAMSPLNEIKIGLITNKISNNTEPSL